jgi:hypothetical protein
MDPDHPAPPEPARLRRRAWQRRDAACGSRRSARRRPRHGSGLAAPLGLGPRPRRPGRRSRDPRLAGRPDPSPGARSRRVPRLLPRASAPVRGSLRSYPFARQSRACSGSSPRGRRVAPAGRTAAPRAPWVRREPGRRVPPRSSQPLPPPPPSRRSPPRHRAARDPPRTGPAETKWGGRQAALHPVARPPALALMGDGPWPAPVPRAAAPQHAADVVLRRPDARRPWEPRPPCRQSS